MSWLGELGSAFFGALYDYRIPIFVASLAAVILLAVVARRRGWVDAARRHPRGAALGLVLAAMVGLPIAWYMASPLVLSSTIDEPPPAVAAAPRGTPVPSSPSVSPSPVRSPSAAAVESPPPTPAAPSLIARSGPFHGSDDFHFGRGTARLIETAPGSFVVRLEDFAVRNGPDLYVYLSPSADGYAKGAIELGRLKADTGNQNYPVPDGAIDDPAKVASVVIWCKQFSHLFATAPLAD
jgi:hypothetical protein